MGIEWLGTPQAALAALALTVTVVLSSEYWRVVEKRRQALVHRGADIIVLCTSALSDTMSHILTRSQLQIEAKRQWLPRGKKVILLTTIYQSQKDYDKVKGTINLCVANFLAKQENHDLTIQPQNLFKSSKESSNV